MPGPANDLNISQPGVVVFDGVSQFFGRTLTAGTGITIVNGTGISGNPTITATGPTAATTFTEDSGNATAAGNVLNVHGGTSISTTSSGNTITVNADFDPNAVINLKDDFIAATVGLTGAALTSELDWWSPGLTMLTNFSTVLSSAHPGLLSNNDTNAGSNWSLFLSSGGELLPSILLGGGAITLNWVIDIATLSAASPRYIFRFGFGDTDNADQANGVYFEYSDNINSGDWVIKTAAASSRTTTNTATAVTTGYKNFQISINAAGTSAEFFIDGVSQGTIATNLPTLAITPFFDMMATVDTVAAHSLRADIMYMQQILTVAR